jgi:hypothetical protein
VGRNGQAACLDDQEAVGDADGDVGVNVRDAHDVAIGRVPVPLDLEWQPRRTVRPYALALEFEREAAAR